MAATGTTTEDRQFGFRNSAINWSAGKAWAAVAGLIAVSLSLDSLARIAVRDSETVRNWLAPPSGRFAFDLLRAALWLLVVCTIGRAASYRVWMAHAGLTRAPSLSGWCMAWAGVAIGLFELYFISRGLAPENTQGERARGHGGGVWFQYVFSTVLLAPIYEEAVMRGFLYRAFRGSYGVMLSTVLVVLVNDGWFHWGLLSVPVYCACLVLGTIALCLIRERTRSTWNCVLFHAAHNATVALHWPFFVGGMLLVLPLCLFRRGTWDRLTIPSQRTPR